MLAARLTLDGDIATPFAVVVASFSTPRLAALAPIDAAPTPPPTIKPNSVSPLTQLTQSLSPPVKAVTIFSRSSLFLAFSSAIFLYNLSNAVSVECGNKTFPAPLTIPVPNCANSDGDLPILYNASPTPYCIFSPTPPTKLAGADIAFIFSASSCSKIHSFGVLYLAINSNGSDNANLSISAYSGVISTSALSVKFRANLSLSMINPLNYCLK